jgi:hypothetical protein
MNPIKKALRWWYENDDKRGNVIVPAVWAVSSTIIGIATQSFWLGLLWVPMLLGGALAFALVLTPVLWLIVKGLEAMDNARKALHRWAYNWPPKR